MQVVTDFFDELKSRSKGYASMEYKVTGYEENDLVRLDIKVCSSCGWGARRAFLLCFVQQRVENQNAGGDVVVTVGGS